MGKLILVPTPIGNLGDITLRSIEVLKLAELIFSEDTRVTAKLLSHFGIKSRLESYHSFNEHKVIANYLEKIKANEITVLVSDAGTPGISDPGYLLVKNCLENEIEVECLPGPTAFVPALIKSGLPTDRFCFEGFLPHKKGRKTALSFINEDKRTTVLYESPYRIIKLLEEIVEVMGPERFVSVSRELTKMYEETINGSAEEVLQKLKNKTAIKGEFVVVIEGGKQKG